MIKLRRSFTTISEIQPKNQSIPGELTEEVALKPPEQPGMRVVQ